MAVLNFKCKDTEALFEGRRVRRFVNIESAAMRKLATLIQVFFFKESNK
ncbi:hypothetical protein [Nitrosomonas sp.]|nr:hypothetical protein [Nitrosomonas sp.]